MAVIDPDLWRSATHRNLIQHLTSPFASGAVLSMLPIVAVDEFSSRLDISWTTREPLLLAVLKPSLDTRQLQVEATFDPGNETATDLLPLNFAPYTEAGAALLLYRPPTDRETRTAIAFTLSFVLTTIDANGRVTRIPAALREQWLDLHLIEGTTGQMIYLLGAEKQRIRRQGREIAAMRSLSFMRDNALDRLGADLGVPRFSETLVFKKPDEESGASIFGRFRFGERRFGPGRRGEIVTEPRPEPDTEYRGRLRIYHPVQQSNRQQVLQQLNGTGADTAPNQGLLSHLGVSDRFQVVETDNEFGVAIHLMNVGDAPLRTNFLNHIRAVHLIWIQDNAVANAVHQTRYLPASKRSQINDLRSRLRQSFRFEDDNAAIAPMLASALDRVGHCRRALGGVTQWRILRTQDSGSSSRYELGLSVDVEPLATTELDQLADRLNQLAEQLRDPDFLPTEVLEPDELEKARAREVKGLLKSMQPHPASEDINGRWLLEPCGIRTTHRVSSDRIYLSNLPTFGMSITGPSSVIPNAQAQLEVRYHAPGDPGSNVVLVNGLAAAAAEWATNEGEAWTSLTDAEANDTWNQVVSMSTPVAELFRTAGLTPVEVPTAGRPDPVAPIIESLRRLPPDLIETIRLPTSLARRLLAAQAPAIRELRRLIRLLSEQGLTSALPLATSANEVLLVVSVIGLPKAGFNLSERQATGFRWYVVPIDSPPLHNGNPTSIKAFGSRTTFTSATSGLFALIAIGYARRGFTDPYEFRVELPDTSRLNLLQYEFLMNVLHHIHPLGIQINTFSIRQRNVDLDGDGNAEPLPSNISRTYRQFRRSRYRGEIHLKTEEP